MSTTDLLDELLAYLDGPRNGPYEHDLACRRLPAIPLDERFVIIRRLIEKDIQFGLRVAHNALGDTNYRKDILMPALMTCEPADIKHYVEHGMTHVTASTIIVAVSHMRRENPRRVGQVMYYLTARLNEMATQAQGVVQSLLPELAKLGALDFDPETWDGGPDDLEWFAKVHAVSPIIWPPIRHYLYAGRRPRPRIGPQFAKRRSDDVEQPRHGRLLRTDPRWLDENAN